MTTMIDKLCQPAMPHHLCSNACTQYTHVHVGPTVGSMPIAPPYTTCVVEGFQMDGQLTGK